MTHHTLPVTVTKLLEMRAERSPHAAAYACRIADGKWQATSWSDCWRQLRQLAGALQDLGLGRGDHLAILAHTCAEWHLIEHAGMLAGAVIVGIDPHMSPTQIRQILGTTCPVVLVCDKHIYDLPSDVVAHVDHLIQLDARPVTREPINAITWLELQSRAAKTRYDRQLRIDPCDPATLIYTSGTTGQPKAIQYSHQQLMVACQAIHEAFPQLRIGEATLCWLPMAHLFQRMMNLVAISQGATIHFVDDARSVVKCASEVNPAVFAAVPRFYEKLREGIEQSIASLTPIKRWLVGAAVKIARSSRENGSLCRSRRGLYSAYYRITDRLVLAQLRKTMGSRIKFMVTGSAPIAPVHLEFFADLGWPILEAYGLSENSVPIAANRIDACRFGSVGKPLSQNRICIDHDGEILVKGPGVFAGYWREPLERNCFTPDGYYRTGDIGFVDSDGYLFLKGRKSEMFKTSTGRKVYPSVIERVYCEHPLIDGIVVVGDCRPYLIGLISLNVKELSRRLSVPDDSITIQSLMNDRRAVEMVRLAIEQQGKYLAPHERVVRSIPIPNALSAAKGELTTNFKLKRQVVAKHFANEIDQAYCDSLVLSSVHSHEAKIPCLISS